MPLDSAFLNESKSHRPLFPNVELGGLPIAVSAPDEAADRICETAVSTTRIGRGIHLVNAYTIALADRNNEYAKILNQSSANLPDGKPLTWFGRIRQSSLRQVRGPHLFGNTIDRGRSKNVRHFLLGATEHTLIALREELHRRYPGVEIVGHLSPPFREMTNQEVKEQDAFIASSGAHIVWVGLGTPKQDFEVSRLTRELPVVAIAVGAAFDFVAGSKVEAPAWMTRIGFEWLFRLATEPRRLWRRYLFGNVEFLWTMLRKR